MNSDHGLNFLGFRYITPSPLADNILMAALLISLIISAAWICRDARRRGKDPILAFLFLVSAGWPLSIVWWLWLRPLTEEERKAKLMKESSGDCPRCGTSLSGKSSCPNCQWQPTEA